MIYTSRPIDCTAGHNRIYNITTLQNLVVLDIRNNN